jgi:hypothetical protein
MPKDYAGTYYHSSNPQTELTLWFQGVLPVQSLEGGVKKTQLKKKKKKSQCIFSKGIHKNP